MGQDEDRQHHKVCPILFKIVKFVPFKDDNLSSSATDNSEDKALAEKGTTFFIFFFFPLFPYSYTERLIYVSLFPGTMPRGDIGDVPN